MRLKVDVQGPHVLLSFFNRPPGSQQRAQPNPKRPPLLGHGASATEPRAAGCSVLPAAASILSIYPSGRLLAIAYVQFKAEVGPHISNSVSWVFLPSGNSIASQQIISLYDVFNATQKA